jgi:hypothetical protein
MIRKQIVLDERRESLLEQMAKERGISQSEIVREAIDRLARDHEEAAARRAAHERLMKRWENAEPLGLVGPDGYLLWDREARNRRR